MAETVTCNRKTYLKVVSIKGRACDGCAIESINVFCPRTARGGLACLANDDEDGNYILIENTPEALAEHFAWKAANG